MIRSVLRAASSTIKHGMKGIEAGACVSDIRQMTAQPAEKQENSHSDSFADIKISRVMKEKAESGAPTAELFTVKTHDLVFDAVQKMAEANIGAVVVTKGDSLTKSDIAGIITERDYVRKVAVLGKSSKEMKCSSLMTGTRELLTLCPKDSVYKAMQLMEERNIRHIPIFDQGQLLGMLSVKDIIATLISDRESEMASMSSYINVSY